MSHVSKFALTFRDKRTLFKAMKRLNLHPENKVWETYANELGKLIGINGMPMGKLLTGYENSLSIFFIEENGDFVPFIESSEYAGEEFERLKVNLEMRLQRAYTQCALETVKDYIVASGQSAHITSESLDDKIIYTLEIGSGKKFIVSLDSQGEINENVSGVSGRSCLDLTLMFEDILTQSIERTWTHEYDEVIEDHVIQVLKLGC